MPRNFVLHALLTLNNKDQSIMANRNSINKSQDNINAEHVGKNGSDINTDKEEKKHQESTMKTDEINLTVDQEDEPESERRCGLLQDRARLQAKLHSHRFQMIIIGLVAIDFLIVLVQLLMDIQVIKGVHHDHLAIEILHYTSIIILGLFLVEIVVKLYAFGLDFFHHKLEVFDAIVVIVSFALDVAYSGNMDAWDAVGLLVLLRLWRVVRIVNGIALSVKIEMDEKMHHLKEEIVELKTQLEHYKNRCNEQEVKLTEMEGELRKT